MTTLMLAISCLSATAPCLAQDPQPADAQTGTPGAPTAQAHSPRDEAAPATEEADGPPATPPGGMKTPGGVPAKSGASAAPAEKPGDADMPTSPGRRAPPDTVPEPTGSLVSLAEKLLPLVGVLVGALIAALTNRWLRKLERRAEYAARNRREIYAPLYEETKALAETLQTHPYAPQIYTGKAFGIDLPGTHGRFQYWNKLQADERSLRVSDDVWGGVQQVLRLANEYNAARADCESTIDSLVTNAMAEHSHTPHISNLGEVCAPDVLAAPPDVTPGFAAACFGSSESPDAGAIYAEVQSAASVDDDVGRVRGAADELSEAVLHLERLIGDHIEMIIRRYEAQQPRM